PKFTRFIQSMAALTEKTRMGREELEKMVVVTKDLKAQCQAQEAEFESLEAQQKKAKDEVNVLMRRIELLMAEKIKVEQRLEDLRLENNRLDAFLQ
ncbi:uncharacterized protein BJ171DRAFT_408010, partial [Polychytrium aggregatum]|uniref:uncharacterized protein n=1 Tax=Polychytrium aggregatum TaxID=110093 RepID=UPI0022FE8CCA